MVELFRQLRPYCPGDALEWVISSFDNMKVRLPDGSEHKWTSTLPSGSRATSFINTVLNAAYMRCALGVEYTTVNSLHVGDDVHMTGGTDQCCRVATLLETAPIKMNRAKQSFGAIGMELLRVSTGAHTSCGYLARAVSTLVAGNWTTSAELDGVEFIRSINQGIWNMVQRSRDRRAGLLLHTTVARRLPRLGRVEDFCLLQLSVAGTPVMTSDDALRQEKVLKMRAIVQRDKQQKQKLYGKPSYATDAYLGRYMKAGDLVTAGVSLGLVRSMMLRASYIEPAPVTNVHFETAVAVDITAVCGSGVKKREFGSRTPLERIVEYLRPVLTDWQMDQLMRAFDITGEAKQRLLAVSHQYVGVAPMGVPYEAIVSAAANSDGNTVWCGRRDCFL